METRAFAPLYTRSTASANGTLQASVTVTGSVAAANSTQLGFSTNGPCQIQIANTTTAWAYVNFGVLGAVTAATVATGFPIAPGVARTVSVDPEVTGVSVILGAAPGTNTAVIFSRGEGI